MIRTNYHPSGTVVFSILFFLTLTLTPSCTPKATTTESKTGKEIKLETIDKGYYAGITGSEISFYAINDENDFNALFKKIHSAEIPHPKIMTVDFSGNIVIAAIHGERPTGGYSMTIDENAFLSDGKLTVKVFSKKPPPGSMLTQAFSNPYTVLSVPTLKWQISEVCFKDASGNILKIISLPNSK